MTQVVLQDRDINIFLGLFESRIMTLQHVATLYFEGSHQATKKRLQLLKSARYVGTRKGTYSSQILNLSRGGYQALMCHRLVPKQPRLDWKSFHKRSKVSEATIRHELDVMTVKAALVPAVRRRTDGAMIEFLTWPRLFAFRANRPVTHEGVTRPRSVLMKPDGFIRIKDTNRVEGLEHVFYLEVDRGTETLSTLAHKTIGYRDYLKNGDFARRYSDDPTNLAPATFRLLMIFRTAERRNNVAEVLLALTPPIRTLAWLTTMDEIIADPLGPIWIRPKDYLDATAGTGFAPDPQRQGDRYVRRPDREAHVETKIAKHRLFDEQPAQ